MEIAKVHDSDSAVFVGKYGSKYNKHEFLLPKMSKNQDQPRLIWMFDQFFVFRPCRRRDIRVSTGS